MSAFRMNGIYTTFILMILVCIMMTFLVLGPEVDGHSDAETFREMMQMRLGNTTGSIVDSAQFGFRNIAVYILLSVVSVMLTAAIFPIIYYLVKYRKSGGIFRMFADFEQEANQEDTKRVIQSGSHSINHSSEEPPPLVLL